MKTLIAGAPGALDAVKNTFVGEGINQVAGDRIGKEFAYLVDRGARSLQGKFQGLAYEDAAALVTLGSLASLTIFEGASALKTLRTHIDFKSFKIKIDPDAGLAYAGVGGKKTSWFESDVDVDIDGNVLLRKADIPDSVQKVGGRNPINAQYAGKVYPVDKLPAELQIKYPNSVELTPEGSVILTPYAIKRVEIEYSGNSKTDIRMANKAAGMSKTPDGYTWHHYHDAKTMELVPKDLHDFVRHTGGFAIHKHNKIRND